MTDRTRRACEHFPTQADLIEQLLTESSEFKSLCEDYGECVEMLETLTRSSDTLSSGRIDEYQLLQLELAREILQLLRKHSQSPDK